MPLVLALALTAAVVLLTALVLVRRRRRAGAPDDVDAVEVTEVAEVVEAVEVAEVAGSLEVPDESATVRALRAQVRSLEQALEVAPDLPVPVAALPAADSAYRRQVLLAARAVAARTGDGDDARHAAARVVATVERLEVDGFVRPVLPGIASRTVDPLPRPSARPAAFAPPPTPPVLTPRTEDEDSDGLVDEVEAEVEVVVPVPPPAPDQPRRSRRLRRRHATTAA